MKLEISGLSFRYEETHLFRDFSISCESRSNLWLRGNSGCGKSTFLKLAAGLLSPEKGRIQWGETNLSTLSTEARAQFRRTHIAYCDQDLHLINSWSAAENLQLVAKDDSKMKSVLQDLGIPKIENQVVRNLSGGERQRLAIARLILQEPEVALLDEPTSHLDDFSCGLVMKALKRHVFSKTLILVSHDRRMEEFFEPKSRIDFKSELT